MGVQTFLDWIAGSVDKEADFSDDEDDGDEDGLAYAAADPDEADF